MSAAGKIGDVFGRSGCFQIAIFVRDANDGVRVADIDPLGIVSRRIESDAVRTVKAFNEDEDFFGLAVAGDSAENFDFAAAAFRQEKITVRSGADQARIVEACRV